MSDLKIKEVIGGAGTGKTTMMVSVLCKALERPEVGGNPFALGFSSFTRAARGEAAKRAGAAWGMDPSVLEREGWFRTAHSVAYRQLGVQRGEVIAGGKEDDKWVSEALGSDVSSAFDDEEEGGIRLYAGDPVAAASLNYWSLARSLVCPLRDVVEADQNPEAPPADEVIKRIESYEQAKRLEGRIDFTDMLGRFVGLRFDPATGPIEATPEGAVPDNVVGWIFDEAQDASKLLDMACRRLVTGDACKWVWLVGDPFQCQPAGTPVLTTKGYKAIESLDPESDWLIAYNKEESQFHGKGKQIPFQKASRVVDSGSLVEIVLADGTKHISTDNHKWLCRTQRGDWYATYIMRKGDRWRVGTVQMFAGEYAYATKDAPSKGMEFRVACRMHQEQADAVWIIKVFPTDRDARLHEQIVSVKYGIPQVTFRPPCGKTNLSREFIDAVYEGVGETVRGAHRCLEDHGRSPLHPYVSKCDRQKNGRHASRFLEACNILPMITLLPRVKEDAFVGMQTGRRRGVYRPKEAAARRLLRNRVDWVPVVSVRRLDPGTPTVVYSLNVERYHTYITENRYITGNCIYGWSGATAAHFMSWGTKDRSIMPRSYRCAPPIMALGERCLQRLPDYWDRGIAPADHDGRVEESENYEDDLADIDPREETLVIARTNRHVKNIAAILDDIGIPFRRTKSRGETLNRDLGMAGLWKLQHGEAATAEEWTHAIDLLPSKTIDGRTWLTRGSKSAWNKGLKSQFDYIFPEEIERLGATTHLQEAIRSGAWGGLCDGGTKWTNAAKRWGIEVVEKPKVKIGTIHSVKGMEASKVIVLTSVGRRTRESEEADERRFAEERRIEYVACTRAKHTLVVAHDPRERYRMELPV